MATKKHFFQADENGVLHIAFVGTEEELQAQIDKDYSELIAKASESLGKYKEELKALENVDLANITAENIADAKKKIFYISQIIQTEQQLKNFKKPSIEDGTYFIVEKIGKDLTLEEHK